MTALDAMCSELDKMMGLYTHIVSQNSQTFINNGTGSENFNNVLNRTLEQLVNRGAIIVDIKYAIGSGVASALIIYKNYEKIKI